MYDGNDPRVQAIHAIVIMMVIMIALMTCVMILHPAEEKERAKAAAKEQLQKENATEYIKSIKYLILKPHFRGTAPV